MEDAVLFLLCFVIAFDEEGMRGESSPENTAITARDDVPSHHSLRSEQTPKISCHETTPVYINSFSIVTITPLPFPVPLCHPLFPSPEKPM
jgi:hypothetical protein